MSSDEDKVSDYLAHKGLRANVFSKEARQKGKTPDFSVYSNNGLEFYCEVKSIQKDTVQGLRKDPVFNRLTDDVHTAVKQLHAVNENTAYPDVLAFVNHDDKCGFLDLIAVLTGDFINQNEEHYPIYRQFSEGRIKDEKSRIHLFIWLDDFKPERLLFSQTQADFHQRLCKLFGVPPDSIKQVGS